MGISGGHIRFGLTIRISGSSPTTSIRFIYLICSHLQHHPRVFTSRSSSGFSLWVSTFHVELYLGDFFATHQFLLGLQHHHQLQHDLYIPSFFSSQSHCRVAACTLKGVCSDGSVPLCG